MMCVPLSFNQIYKAIGTDRNVLGQRCGRIRAARGLGPWPRQRTRIERATLVARMVAISMGFNEIHRALGGGRNELSKLYQEITGQTSMDGLKVVHGPVS
jgi:hypothetical protein